MDQEKIGKFIAELRKNKKLTQEELAAKLNINSRSISRWENGKCMPDISLLIPLSKILETTVNNLLCGKKMPNQEAFEENIVKVIAKVDKTNKKYKNFFKGLFIAIIIIAILSLLSCIINFNRIKSNKSLISLIPGHSITTYPMCVETENEKCPLVPFPRQFTIYSGIGYSIIKCEYCDKKVYIVPLGLGTYPYERLDCKDEKNYYEYLFSDGILDSFTMWQSITEQDITDFDTYKDKLNEEANIPGCASDLVKLDNSRYEKSFYCEISKMNDKASLSLYGIDSFSKTKTRKEIIKDFKKSGGKCYLSR